MSAASCKNEKLTPFSLRSSQVIVECIPSAILQTVFFLKSGSSSALFTAFASAITTGYTMTSLSYDFDTSPEKRRSNGSFYGYIPDKTKDRLMAFLCLFMASCTHTTWRVFSSSLLIMVDWRYLVGYLGTEIALFLAYKTWVGDLQYWIPLSGPAGFIFSLIWRW